MPIGMGASRESLARLSPIIPSVHGHRGVSASCGQGWRLAYGRITRTVACRTLGRNFTHVKSFQGHGHTQLSMT